MEWNSVKFESKSQKNENAVYKLIAILFKPQSVKMLSETREDILQFQQIWHEINYFICPMLWKMMLQSDKI